MRDLYQNERNDKSDSIHTCIYTLHSAHKDNIIIIIIGQQLMYWMKVPAMPFFLLLLCSGMPVSNPPAMLMSVKNPAL